VLARACAQAARATLFPVEKTGTFRRLAQARKRGRPHWTDPAHRSLTTLPAALPASVQWGPPAAAAMRMRIRLDPGDVDRPVASAARDGPVTLVPGLAAR
jgi:hypothetical protein